MFDTTIEDVLEGMPDLNLKAFTQGMLAQVDDAFWTAPASISGKYHPPFDQGEGGLVRHTIVCAAFALEALRRYKRMELKSVVLCAALMHDTYKRGIPPRKYDPNHGAVAAEQMVVFGRQHPECAGEIHMAAYGCQNHMGIWSQSKESGPSPLDFRPEDDQRDYAIVALTVTEGDYFSSRKLIDAVNDEQLAATFSLAGG
jgi:hypothetical protein